jgi:hypothetical protein
LKETKKILILLNHIPAPEQLEDIEKQLNAKIETEADLKIKEMWSNIPPAMDKISLYLEPVKKWILKNSNESDFVWVQGESGALFNIVNFCLKNKRKPIYSVTKRNLEKEIKEENQIKTTRIFKHVKFRFYEAE